jgi:hypothetical protein
VVRSRGRIAARRVAAGTLAFAAVIPCREATKKQFDFTDDSFNTIVQLMEARTLKSVEQAGAWDAWAKRAHVVPGPARFSGDGAEAVSDGEATPNASADAGAKKKCAANG